MEAVLAVVILCSVVLLGWLLAGSTWITHVLPDAVTMKPATALSFVLLGIGLLLRRRHCLANWLLSAGAAAVWLAQFGMLPFLEFEGEAAAWSVGANVPSWATTIAATCVALASIARRWWLFASTAAIGATALLGYALQVPALFFYVDGVSTAMAFHTGASFLVFGVAGAAWLHASTGLLQQVNPTTAREKP